MFCRRKWKRNKTDQIFLDQMLSLYVVITKHNQICMKTAQIMLAEHNIGMVELLDVYTPGSTRNAIVHFSV